MPPLVQPTFYIDLQSSIVTIISANLFSILAIFLTVKNIHYSYFRVFLIPITLFVTLFTIILAHILGLLFLVVTIALFSLVAYATYKTLPKRMTTTPTNSTEAAIASSQLANSADASTLTHNIFNYVWFYILSFKPTTTVIITIFNISLLIIAAWPITLQAISGQVEGGFGVHHILMLVVAVIFPLSLVAHLTKSFFLTKSWIDKFMIFSWQFFILIVSFFAVWGDVE